MDLSAVKSLIEKGAPVNSRVNSDSSFRSGFTPLHIAVELNKFEIVQYLLNHGADPYMEVGDRFEDTPLHLASDCEIPSFHDLYESLLHTSGPNDAMQSYLKDRNRIIELLIKRGVPINEKNLAGNTPLMVALSAPISFGSYRNGLQYVSNPEGKLLKQIYEGHRSTVALLLHHGADVHVRNKRGQSVLHRTTDQGEIWHKKLMTEMMLKRGVDANVADEKGVCPLVYVMISTLQKPSDISLLRLFCKYGVDINTKHDRSGNTALHEIAQNYGENESDLHEVIDFILDHPEIELNALNSAGNTPLHIAAKENVSDFPELSKDFDWLKVEPPPSELNNSTFVEKLLGAGADICVKNSAGLTPFHQLHKWLMKYSSRSDRYYTDMFIVVLTHLKKLMKMGISLDDQFHEKFNQLSQIRPKVGVVLDRVLDQEVTKMKSKMIDPRTSLYDILLKNASSMAKYAKNGELRKIMEFPKFTYDYLLFHGMLIQQFNKGLVRSLLLEPAIEALDVLLGVRLSPCAEYILKLLDNEDMKNLIESISDGKTWKRSTFSSYILEKCQLKIRRTPANQHWISFVELAIGMQDILPRN
ncbi:hypothetical protein QAD02_006308 [Eretmocerus hayati]|uniref:Uncharacterized protein n=1 Tax=Eretmocerus hayati TaxID=131215 RepID=A0ACC2N1N3_9HYME|nr:hypothetical protein QAD02_006308 [Eretmocerus hayati]